MRIEEVIGLVEKWIADPESVSKKELKTARDAARDVFNVAVTLRNAVADWNAVAYAVAAASAAMSGHARDAKFWVVDYHKSIND